MTYSAEIIDELRRGVSRHQGAAKVARAAEARALKSAREHAAEAAAAESCATEYHSILRTVDPAHAELYADPEPDPADAVHPLVAGLHALADALASYTIPPLPGGTSISVSLHGVDRGVALELLDLVAGDLAGEVRGFDRWAKAGRLAADGDTTMELITHFADAPAEQPDHGEPETLGVELEPWEAELLADVAAVVAADEPPEVDVDEPPGRRHVPSEGEAKICGACGALVDDGDCVGAPESESPAVDAPAGCPRPHVYVARYASKVAPDAAVFERGLAEDPAGAVQAVLVDEIGRGLPVSLLARHGYPGPQCPAATAAVDHLLAERMAERAAQAAPGGSAPETLPPLPRRRGWDPAAAPVVEDQTRTADVERFADGD